MKGDVYPDFIGIGAQKAGTTWLYHNLRNHPQIWIPRKEVHYFDHRIKETSFSLRERVFGKSEAYHPSLKPPMQYLTPHQRFSKEGSFRPCTLIQSNS